MGDRAPSTGREKRNSKLLTARRLSCDRMKGETAVSSKSVLERNPMFRNLGAKTQHAMYVTTGSKLRCREHHSCESEILCRPQPERWLKRQPTFFKAKCRFGNLDNLLFRSFTQNSSLCSRHQRESVCLLVLVQYP